MKKLILGGVALLLLIAGCATRISDLKDDPQRYNGRTVTLRGVVNRALPLPVGNLSLQILGQDDDSALLISRVDRRRGDEAVVKVRVVAFPEDETSEAWERGARTLADFLVDHDLVERPKAQDMVRTVVRAIRAATDRLGQLFLLVEMD